LEALADGMKQENWQTCAALHYRVSFCSMIAELDCVALTADLPEYGLATGDVGTVVHVFKGGKTFMVEFTTFSGTTIAVTKIAATGVRPISRKEIHHTRPFEPVVR
jgi:hypothetical protein